MYVFLNFMLLFSFLVVYPHSLKEKLKENVLYEFQIFSPKYRGSKIAHHSRHMSPRLDEP
jgi:hypothetical protein